jgi:peptide deformylase
MSTRPITKEPAAVLRQIARPVPKVTKAVRSLIGDMIDSMYAAHGVGIAAPQIGQPLQIFVANAQRQRGKELIAINPKLELLDGTETVVQEGCLSLPQVWAEVGRPSSVRLRAWNEKGKPYTVDADGLLAVILQHEYDHLQGKLFIDRLPPWHRQRLLDKYRQQCA